MRLEYTLIAALGIAGCASEPVIPAPPAYKIPQPETPRPFANIKPYGQLTLSPEANIEIMVTDTANRRSIRDVRMYIVPEGKQSIALNVLGSTRELEINGKASFFIDTQIQFTAIPNGPARFVLDIHGNGTGTYSIPITVRKQSYAMTMGE